MSTVAFHTLGCKVNFYETQAIEEKFVDAGFEVVGFDDVADVYVVNTCSVTNVADKKSRQMLHRAKKKNPSAVVVATGCYVQSAKEKLLLDKAIDLVVGNNKKSEILALTLKYMKDNQKNSCIVDLMHDKSYEKMVIRREGEKTRAFIKVTDGCNLYCTYCIIPYTRGKVRSREMKDCLDEITGLAHVGYKEVVLSGIHLSSYGTDFKTGERLIDLIENVAKIDGIERIRLGSFEPRMVTREFVERLEKCPKICRHFHLSLQSGCDTVLKRMNRQYNTKQYLEIVNLIREYMPDAMLTTDVIVGFPGETDEEFLKTVEYLREIKFYEMHVFKYSRRNGTPADKMKDQVDEQIKSKRSETLIRLDDLHQEEYNKKSIGQVVEVLVEEKVILDGKEYSSGHTMNYMRVIFESEKDLNNQVVKVKTKEVLKGRMVLGEIVN